MSKGSLRFRSLHGVALLAVFIFFPGIRASAGVSNFCPIGTCVVDNPVYVNVYWDSSPAQWDTDVAAKSSSAGMTQARIDAITRAILASGYFFPMASDYKIFTATWGGSMTPPCEAPPADVDTALSKMSDLVNCVMTANPALNNGNTILNVFLPPRPSIRGFAM